MLSEDKVVYLKDTFSERGAIERRQPASGTQDESSVSLGDSQVATQAEINTASPGINSPVSAGKGSENVGTGKGDGENSGDLSFSTREAEEAGERAQQIVDEAEERIEAKRREEQQEREESFGIQGETHAKRARGLPQISLSDIDILTIGYRYIHYRISVVSLQTYYKIRPKPIIRFSYNL